MTSFDAFVNDLTAGDADLKELNAQPTKGTRAADAASKEVHRSAKVGTARPAPRATARQKLIAKMHAFEEQNPGLGTFLKNASWSEFASSLYQQLITKGTLSPKQVDAANRMRAKSEAKKPAGTEVDLSPIREMFEAARDNGHKRPVYRAEGLVINRAPDTGNNPGALYVKADGEYQGKVLGTEFTGTRATLPETLTALAVIAKNPLEAAVAYGRRTGTCACCGRELTNAKSIELGIGPICRDKWGL